MPDRLVFCECRSDQSTLRAAFRTAFRAANPEANRPTHTATDRSPLFSTVEATYFPTILATGWLPNWTTLFTAHRVADLTTVD